MNRKHSPAPESVDQVPGLALDAQARSLQKFALVARLQRSLGKDVAALQVKAEFKLLNCLVGESALANVGQSHGAAVVVVPHPLTELLDRERVDRKHALAPVAHRFLLGSRFFFLNFNIVLLGEPAKCVGVRQLFVLHQERHDRAAFARRKALENAFGRNHIKRRRLLLRKRTQPPKGPPAALQGHKFTHHFLNTRGVENAVNCGW